MVWEIYKIYDKFGTTRVVQIINKNQEKVTALILYIDDKIFTGNDEKERKSLQNVFDQSD